MQYIFVLVYPHVINEYAQNIFSSPESKACTPELAGFLHFNASLGQLLQCNGISWKPWAATDEVISIKQTTSPSWM